MPSSRSPSNSSTEGAPDDRLVIFDCDGVLVDSERLTVEVEARMLTELGWPITVAEVVRRFVGGSSDAMLAEVERHLGAEKTAEFDRRSSEVIAAAFHTMSSSRSRAFVSSSRRCTRTAWPRASHRAVRIARWS